MAARESLTAVVSCRAPMARTDFKSVDEYIAVQPAAAQVALRRVRAAIRKALPGADEVISYQIPTFKRDGAYVVYFAGWKEHYSLYPASRELAEAFADELAPYTVHKGTIRFPLSDPVPVKLIERIARFMGKQASDRAKARRPRPRKR
jgi:uncharacterized protein YdhG (YjbR/CyaY superfamily)